MMPDRDGDAILPANLIRQERQCFLAVTGRVENISPAFSRFASRARRQRGRVN